MSIYNEKTSYSSLDNLFAALLGSIYCECPCRVEEVNNNSVDVTVFRNDEQFYAANVPIKRPETQRAYIFLGIKKGDRGIISFTDKTIENYKKDGTTTDDGRLHSKQDGIFELGFIPDSEAFIYPTNADIEIGLKDGSAKINLTSGNITINGGNVNITGSNVNLGSNTTIDGKVFLEHTHSNGNNGANTGGVV